MKVHKSHSPGIRAGEERAARLGRLLGCDPQRHLLWTFELGGWDAGVARIY